MHPAGYNRQRQESTVKVLSPLRQIEIKAVTRKDVIGQALAVTASMAPAAVDFLGHIRFPLKHEEVEELAILAQCPPLVTGSEPRATIAEININQ
ncbi:hypothetical protein [Pseudomonas sp. DC3200b2]|uniref:hypothetical protein n=1 Tax=Pseudomonas sp. DC3200b2 TaxID=2804669 RepID=UPI003AE22D36